jgi:hypothetical protein
MTVLLLSLLASGTRVVYQELPCPVGDDVVRVYQLVSSNTLGGYDSDLATYASQGQFREYAVATCAASLFSLPVTHIQEPIDPALQPKLLAALAQEVAALPHPEEPTVWERYGIAARMIGEMGGGPMEQAELYLQASWTARDTVVGYQQGLSGPESVASLMAMGTTELAKPLTDTQRRTVLYTLARAAHRGGMSEARTEYLQQFEAVGGLSVDEREALVEFRLIAQTIEPRYQDLAIAAFQEALRGSLPAEVRLRATYLIADLMRRQERFDEALPLYESVISDSRTPGNIREMAELLVSGMNPR